jgi:hypothetical protein
MRQYNYQGQELDVFAAARNWKMYFKSFLMPYFGERVLEVGAGQGATTRILCDGQFQMWLCSEPDDALRNKVDEMINQQELPACCHTTEKLIADIDPSVKFDTILYIDVLEHIQNDRGELERASQHLMNSGHLIILAPAYQYLFSDFDRAIGHYKRYDKASLSSLKPSHCRITRSFYLDSTGLLTSLVNKLLLKQSTPSQEQILFWDRFLIPISKVMDRVLNYRIGRSIVVIWSKDAE